MRRLLQGDVGSGKTIVALQAMLVAIENGYQAALMAPTEILATQHFLSARKLLEHSGQRYKTVLLTGSLDEEKKRRNRRLIADGEAQMVIGTHALIEEKVEFAKAGLVVVDEQHRFGVLQRFRLMKKPNAAEPDVLIMTATPIPRTLALSLYGDLDLSVLDELPPGRTPILTRQVSDRRAGEVWTFVRKQVEQGRQVYVVYPVIEGEKAEHPELDFAGDGGESAAAATSAKSSLKAASAMYEELGRGALQGLRLGLLHGRLDADSKEIIMRRFQRGEIDVLIATTVIEVGVDVANATVMVIEHAERFGLAQLHQLRGRVGRGAAKSYCILMTAGKASPQGEQRLSAMVRTQNGFELAELDLELRGPGEFFGTRQAGLPDFRIANLVRDRVLLELAKREAANFATKPANGDTEEERSRVWAHLRDAWQRRYGLLEAG
jgi:ATP-dependent DNA helicase RecG